MGIAFLKWGMPGDRASSSQGEHQHQCVMPLLPRPSAGSAIGILIQYNLALIVA